MQPNNEPAGNWGYRQENGATEDPQFTSPNSIPTGLIDPQQAQESNSVTWTASEFLSHQKSAGWYVMVVVVGIALNALAYLLTRDLMTSAVLFVALILFLIISANKPRQLTYQIDPSGISIGEKFYPFQLFKSFAIMKDGAISSINLVPLKRFMPEITVYYAPADEAKILNVLVYSLPNDQKAERITDRLMKQIRF